MSKSTRLIDNPLLNGEAPEPPVLACHAHRIRNIEITFYTKASPQYANVTFELYKNGQWNKLSHIASSKSDAIDYLEEIADVSIDTSYVEFTDKI